MEKIIQYGTETELASDSFLILARKWEPKKRVLRSGSDKDHEPKNHSYFELSLASALPNPNIYIYGLIFNKLMYRICAFYAFGLTSKVEILLTGENLKY